MSSRLGLVFTLFAAFGLTTSCATEEPGVYRGGQRVQEGPLEIQNRYTFRFVDKWRISHNWLSGPSELRGCQGYLLNPFRFQYVEDVLSYESNSPFIEKEGFLYVVGEHKGVWVLSNRRENIYGTNSVGKFEGYSPFCGQVFPKDSLDGMGLYILRPDPAKGTD